MKFRTILFVFLTVLALVALSVSHPNLGWAAPESLPVSKATQECLDCHESDTPLIVEEWRSSRHARITPEVAMKKPALEKTVSSTAIPETMRRVVVGCFECHGQSPSSHGDTFKHNDFSIHTVVSPPDCQTCHATEVEEYAHSKKANALDILQKNPVYHLLVNTITGNRKFEGGKLLRLPPSENTKNKTCYSCHGTRVEAKGMKTIVVDGDEMQVPNLTNWPNQGVGRINPDGSSGACTPCHPRHGFSLEVARKPETCSQCHLAPDVPAFEIYMESKHGNIYASKKGDWNWDHVPWRVGKDFTAPTCAACHNALLTTPDGKTVIAKRSHDFGARLWVRIFGLIYSHPQPRDARTYIIRNSDGSPMPTNFDGTPASEFLLNPKEQQVHQGLMKAVCLACHGTSFSDGHFAQLDQIIQDTDAMVKAATDIMKEGWSKGLADPTNPFDEVLEQKWIRQWLFYANSVRYGAAMGGPDYSAFKNGWWYLTENLEEMAKEVQSDTGKKP